MFEIKTLLVDDEPLALSLLQQLLADIPCITIVARCRNGREALSLLQRQEIDLMFLDVHMPGLDGLQLIRRLQSDVMPLVIFATAHPEHALQAFDLNALDYVLKPFAAERVGTAVARAREQLAMRGDFNPKGKLLYGLRPENAEEKELFSSITPELQQYGKLPIKNGHQIDLIDFESIGWIDAAGDYMCIHAGGDTHVLRSTMKELTQRLPPVFARIHRSTIVNLDHIQTVDTLPKGECLIHLNDDIALKVSRNYRNALRHLL
ncbi:DNA-binding response regulator [Kineobactrum sediminis]|uniref:DNA-binding response regulator n=1 Tax=Kineobactrum sediminis TaxID=1905677 RepID=A0A2N5Y4S0_9GAMM|nr:LytTR family DNA-binding domain-containing protein [Kineobactrum sediminis]PLW83369.1 DNA-binding response regulator [Kineobactrum sediminis]